MNTDLLLTVANDDSSTMDMDGFSSSDSEASSDVDTETKVDTQNDEEHSENCDADTEDDESIGEDEMDQEPLLAQAPCVLQPSDVIQTVVGVPVQRRHYGFHICGDNIDKMIRKRFMRSDQGNISAHYFHLYAVQNRIDFSQLLDDMPDNSSVNDLGVVARSLQPTEMDDTVLRRNMMTLISRILCTRMKFFQVCFDDIVNWHIQHRYSKEMSLKSVVVSVTLCS